MSERTTAAALTYVSAFTRFDFAGVATTAGFEVRFARFEVEVIFFAFVVSDA